MDKDCAALYVKKFAEENAKRYPDRCPVAQLDPKYVKSETNPNPPDRYFGLPATTAEIFDYAKDTSFPDLPDTVVELQIQMIRNIVKQLSQVIGHKITIRCPDHRTSAGVDLVLCLYTNHSDSKLGERKERAVVGKLRSAFDWDDMVVPLWYHPIVKEDYE